MKRNNQRRDPKQPAPQTWQLDRESPIPLYLQIRQQLVALISEWPDPDEKFLTDEELARQFDVAKATARQAVADLSRSGLLRRKRGAGTYVVLPLVERLRPVYDIEPQHQMTGAAIVHRIHAFETRAATAVEARILEIETGSPVISLRRVRSVAHVPLAIDDRVMSVEVAERLNLNIDTATGSIIDLVQSKFTLSKASWELNARLAGERDAILLQIAPTDPILVRSLVYFEVDDTPILTGETRHRSDMLRCGFEMDLTNSSLDSNVQSWTNEAFLAAPPLD